MPALPSHPNSQLEAARYGMQSSGSMIYLFPPQLFLPTGSTDLGQPGQVALLLRLFQLLEGRA